MPIYDFRFPTPISNLYTYEQAASEVMTLTKVSDNEKVQLANIRNHINISITQVIELVGVSKIPKYGMYLKAAIENELHHSGLHYINLEIPAFDRMDKIFVACRGIKDIVRMSVRKNSDYSNLTALFPSPARLPDTDLDAQPLLWDNVTEDLAEDLDSEDGNSAKEGNFTKLDLTQLQQLNSRSESNVQWNQSLGWSWEGNNIYLFIGKDIATPFQGIREGEDANAYTLPHMDISLYCYRQPLLDDLLPLSKTQTYRQKMDIPDEYIGLVIALAQKKVLEQLNADPNQQMEVNQKVQLELSKLQQNLNEDVQFEKIQREKIKYGDI
jgi:hypothetical protein